MAWERVEWVPNHGSGVEESRLLAIMVGVGLLGRREARHLLFGSEDERGGGTGVEKE